MLTMPIKQEVNFWNPLFFPIFIDITNSWYDPEKEEAASRKLLDMGV